MTNFTYFTIKRTWSIKRNGVAVYSYGLPFSIYKIVIKEETLKNISLALPLLILTGCGTISKNYIPDEIMTQSTTSTNYIDNKGIIDLSKINASDLDGTTNQSNRNDFIAKAISLSDRKCNIHKATIIANSHTWNVATGSASILLAGASSVINHAKTAAELAAGAAASTGIQSLVNKEVYADALGTTIIRSIEIGRAKKRAALESGLANVDYTLSRALVDLQAYHDACSLMSGLIEVTKAFENRKPSRNELERDITILKEAITNADKFYGSTTTTEKTDALKRYRQELAEKTLLLSSAGTLD